MPLLHTPAPEASRLGRSRRALAIRLFGVCIAVVAVALCLRTLARQWSRIWESVADANLIWLAVAIVTSAAAMTGLGLLWWKCLQAFGAPTRRRDAVSWYFGGELGKYVPGGIWTVLGRGELALRAGVRRTTGYLTTLISYAAMCIAAAVACGLLAPFASHGESSLGWAWLMCLLIPIGVVAVCPPVMGRILAIGHKLTKGRIDPQPQPWSTMLTLILWAVPTWLLVGAASVTITESLRFDQNPSRVAFAAILAWILGFMAVPVPAGAGLRELIFVGLSGLGGPEAVAVAAIARGVFIAVDAIGGLLALWYARHQNASAAASVPTEVPPVVAPTEASVG